MACLRTMRALVPDMRKRGWGRVVNVSSTAGKRPSKLHARVLGREGGAAVAVAPLRRPLRRRRRAGQCGLPRADEVRAVGRRGRTGRPVGGAVGLAGSEEAIEKAGAGRPIGRLAEVEEIAAAIVFLCSEHASYVAGAAWSVDGGTVPVII